MQDKAFYDKYVRPLGLEKLYCAAKGIQKQPGELCELRKTTMKLRSQLKSNQSALEESESRYAALKRKYAALESELDASKRACQSHVKKCAALKSQLSVVNAQLVGVKEDKLACKKAMKDQKSKHAELGRTYWQLVNEHERLKKECSELKESLERRAAAVDLKQDEEDAQVRSRNQVGDACRLSVCTRCGCLVSHLTGSSESAGDRRLGLSSAKETSGGLVEQEGVDEQDDASGPVRNREKNVVTKVSNSKKSGTKNVKRCAVGVKGDKKLTAGDMNAIEDSGRMSETGSVAGVAREENGVGEVMAAELSGMSVITKGEKTDTKSSEQGKGGAGDALGAAKLQEGVACVGGKSGDGGDAEGGLGDTGGYGDAEEERGRLRVGSECVNVWSNQISGEKGHEGVMKSWPEGYNYEHLDAVENRKRNTSSREEAFSSDNTFLACSFDFWRAVSCVNKDELPKRMFDRMHHMESIINTLQEELVRVKQMYAELQQQNSELLSCQSQLSQTDDLNRRLLEHYRYVMNITKTVEESDSEDEQGVLWLP
ncbi:uncharacterized protein LOC126316907 isoform X2 [Schistocerca gregaria]|nr:uncharacterized protein LOC126316907 isoform X2 [Schistocerca gregaria]XP_049848889.1 uncharacterized protein LOC126316907 isoform X2 [Schistocerca gregaria]XP_049848890.1 uncharacterized protein LOC126316907 isoform X2 [Schistocerca gregaria]